MESQFAAAFEEISIILFCQKLSYKFRNGHNQIIRSRYKRDCL